MLKLSRNWAQNLIDFQSALKEDRQKRISHPELTSLLFYLPGLGSKYIFNCSYGRWHLILYILNPHPSLLFIPFLSTYNCLNSSLKSSILLSFFLYGLYSHEYTSPIFAQVVTMTISLQPTTFIIHGSTTSLSMALPITENSRDVNRVDMKQIWVYSIFNLFSSSR